MMTPLQMQTASSTCKLAAAGRAQNSPDIASHTLQKASQCIPPPPAAAAAAAVLLGCSAIGRRVLPSK
jgi:hypothetical protein